ncbi:response regulator [bacterium]|nr:response regulator [bacterium]
MNQNKILVVEDEEVIAFHLEEQLKRLGYSVVGVVNSGDAAIDMVKNHHPDLVLMDIEMPGNINGIEAAREIKDRFQIPVIFMTAYGDDYYINEAKLAEPFGYLIKPFREDDLNASIMIALYKNKVDQKLRHSEEKYRTLVENAFDAIFSFDGEGQIIFWNQAAVNMFGYSPEEIKTQSIHKLIRESDGKKIKFFRDTKHKDDSLPVNEALGFNKDGREFPVEYSICQWGHSKDKDYICIIRDISSYKDTEMALLESQELLAQNNARLNEKNIALKEILNQLEEEKKELRNRITQNANRLILPLVNQLIAESTKGLKAKLKILQTNLKNITSSFGISISETEYNLTQREIEICNCISNGMTTREISKLLNISKRTVDNHRSNIRKKLNLLNNNTGLQNYLGTL